MSSIERVSLLALMATLTLALAGCASMYPSSNATTVSQAKPASYWVGRTISQASANLGQPTAVRYNHGSTGYNAAGRTYIYANAGAPHYVLQTAPGSPRIINARDAD